MEHKTVVITGSTKGIGYGLAKEFLSKGHNVVINGRSMERLSESIVVLKKISKNIIGVEGNVCVEQTHIDITNKALARFETIDIWINNAGIPQPHKKFTEIDSNELKNSVDTNIYGVMLGTKIAAKVMQNQGFGKIFNMEGFGSDGRIMKNLSIYGTTKRAINYYTKSVANEIKDCSIQIGVLSPGMVRTDFLNNSLQYMSFEEKKRFDKVYKALAEDVQPVSRFLVRKILLSSKNYDRIEYLSKTKLIIKLFKMILH